MWVVKLGGSLTGSPSLPLWLDALAETSAVIVAGGGPFADVVRNTQTRWNFDELTAHHMAILAMQQYGRMLAGLCPKLLATTAPEQLAGCHAAVWLPVPEALDEAGIPASWDISSDSLAGWLAGRLGAKHLLLVKSVAFNPPESATCQTLIDDGLIDLRFDEYGMRETFQSWICGPDDYAHLVQGLANPRQYFTAICRHECPKS
ncbi:MAG: amino acid kinase [Methylococcaceae bacterium]|nr:amino acid kinase [Methylococcaceae bacterium]